MFNQTMIIDLLFAVLYIYYGYRYRYLPMSFESKKGLATPRARLNETNWKMAQEYGGMLCFIFSGFFWILFAVKVFFIGYGTWFDYVQVGLEVLSVALLILLVELKLKRDGDFTDNRVDREDDPRPGTVGVREVMKRRREAEGGGKKGKNKKK